MGGGYFSWTTGIHTGARTKQTARMSTGGSKSQELQDRSLYPFVATKDVELPLDDAQTQIDNFLTAVLTQKENEKYEQSYDAQKLSWAFGDAIMEFDSTRKKYKNKEKSRADLESAAQSAATAGLEYDNYVRSIADKKTAETHPQPAALFNIKGWLATDLEEEGEAVEQSGSKRLLGSDPDEGEGEGEEGGFPGAEGKKEEKRGKFDDHTEDKDEDEERLGKEGEAVNSSVYDSLLAAVDTDPDEDEDEVEDGDMAGLAADLERIDILTELRGKNPQFGILGNMIMLIASKLGYAWPSPDRPVTKDQVVLFSAKTVSGRPVSKNMKEDFKKLSNFRPLYPTGPVPEISYAKARFPNARLSRAASGKLYSGSTGETLVQVLNKYEVMTPAEQLVAVNTQRGGKENEYWKGVPGIYAKLLMNLVKTDYIPNLSNDVKLLWVAVVQKFTTTEGKALFDRLLGSSESMKPPFTFFVAESPSRGNVNKFTWDENRSLDSDRDYCYALKILYLPDWDKSRAKIDLAVKGGDYETANGQIRRIMKSGRRPTPEQVMRLLDDGSAEFVKKLRDTYPPLRTAAKALRKLWKESK